MTAAIIVCDKPRKGMLPAEPHAQDAAEWILEQKDYQEKYQFTHTDSFSFVYVEIIDRKAMRPFLEKFHQHINFSNCTDMIPPENTRLVEAETGRFMEMATWCDENCDDASWGFGEKKNQWWFHFPQNHDEALFQLRWG